MTRVALVVAHEGTDFAGWQRQPGRRTVQGELETALGTVLRAPVAVHGAGRTDAGVHARGQVAHVDVAWERDVLELRHRVNALLPEDVRVRAIVEVSPGFHARRDSVLKRYVYRIDAAAVASPLDRRTRLHVGVPLDRDAMARAAAFFVGRRDFAALRSTGSPTLTSVRDVTHCAIAGEPPGIDVVVEGAGFLRHMVRALAGCLLEVGRGRRPPEWIAEVLDAADRAGAAANAPAHGLTLEWVRHAPPDGSRIEVALAAQEAPRRWTGAGPAAEPAEEIA